MLNKHLLTENGIIGTKKKEKETEAPVIKMLDRNDNILEQMLSLSY